jgi:predicted Zn-dependent protease
MEKLYAENTILRKDNSELRCQIRSRKERTKGKRLVLKDICAIATEEVQKALEEAQKATQKGKKKGKKGKAKQRKNVSSSEEEDKEDTDDDSTEEPIEIQDCINVIAR